METDECSSNPCLNNATCVDYIAEYYCVCGSGWEGDSLFPSVSICHLVLTFISEKISMSFYPN